VDAALVESDSVHARVMDADSILADLVRSNQFIGPVTGNVTGDLTGDVTGDVDAEIVKSDSVNIGPDVFVAGPNGATLTDVTISNVTIEAPTISGTVRSQTIDTLIVADTTSIGGALTYGATTGLTLQSPSVIGSMTVSSNITAGGDITADDLIIDLINASGLITADAGIYSPFGSFILDGHILYIGDPAHGGIGIPGVNYVPWVSARLGSFVEVNADSVITPAVISDAVTVGGIVISEEVIVSNGVTTYKLVIELADDADYTLSVTTGVAGRGYVRSSVEYATFGFNTSAQIQLVTAGTVGLTSTNVSGTNGADGKLNIYDGGPNVRIDNQLGSTLLFMVVLEFFTP
jgi:hypothetical protein